MLTFAKRLVRRLETEIAWRRHRSALGAADSVYMDTQLRRSIARRRQPLQQRTRILVDQLAQTVPLAGASVLCVGCRNVRELEYIAGKGAAAVVGLDLFSEYKNILIGDMHCMGFAAASFDVVYSSHSLEHAHDPHLAVSEFARVLRPGGAIVVEVPVRYPTTDADLVDFGSADRVASLLAGVGAQVLWQDEQPPHVSANDGGTHVARVIAQTNEGAPQP
jgi:SAM-dependent methyltransferase